MRYLYIEGEVISIERHNDAKYPTAKVFMPLRFQKGCGLWNREKDYNINRLKYKK